MSSRPSPWVRFRRDETGAVAVLASVWMLIAVACAGLVIDGGAAFLESRRLQGIADLAALAAARDLTNAEAAAGATGQANEVHGRTIELALSLGAYTRDQDVPAAQRFTANAASPNAVQVTLTTRQPLIFGGIIGKPEITISRQATAMRAEMASFTVGSRLASLQGGAANALLSTLTGSQVELSVMDYNALLGAEVDLFSYVQALRTEAGLQAATFDETLAADVTPGQALTALGSAAGASGDQQAAAAIETLAHASGNGGQVDLDRLIDMGPYGPQDYSLNVPGAEVSVPVMDMATAILSIANEGRQLKLELAASAPGLADLEAWLGIGERPVGSPWLTVNSDGQTVVRTTQMRLYLTAEIGGQGLLSAAAIKLPVYVEAASAEAKLASASCPVTPAAQSVTLSVRPNIASVAIGEIDASKIDNFGSALTVKPAKLVSLPLIKATGSADISVGDGSWQSVNFTRSEIAAGAVKTVATQNPVQGLTSSLVSTLSLNVSVLGLGLNVNGITQSLSSSLSVAAAPVDAALAEILGVLGVSLGEADVRVGGLRCRDAALVA